MPGNAESLKTSLGVDTTDFKLGLAAANRELKVLESGFKASVSTLGDWGNSISGVELRQKALTSQIDIQKAKVAALRSEYERQVTANGDMSSAAQKAEIDLNKGTEQLGKMQTELKGTDTALDNMRNGLNAAGQSTKELKDKQKSLGEQLKGSWTEINSAIGVAKQAYQLLKSAVDETVGAFVKYADQVREISQVSGQSAEDVSRVIQVMDDYKIKTDSLNTVMRKMATDGLSLSIDSLAKLSDEYLKLNSGAARQLFLTKEFGREGVDFAEIMLQGSAAIRDQAAAVSKGLILTDAALRKAREYEIAQDGVNDALKALKIQMGEISAPLITNIMSTAALRMEAHGLGIDIMENFFQYKNYATLLADVKAKEKELAIATRHQTDETNLETGATRAGTLARRDAIVAAIDYSSQLSNIIGFAKQYETSLQNVQTAGGNLEEAEAELHKLIQAGWSLTGTKVAAAQEKVQGLRDKLGEAQQASLDATNEMIAGFLQAQLAADGSFTEEDINKVLDYRLKVGLLTQEAYDAALNALSIAQNLASIPAKVDSEINIHTNYTYSEEPHRHITARAGGGSGSGWLQVGDAPGGGITPYTEWIYTPEGSAVFNQSQMKAAMRSLAEAFMPEVNRRLPGGGESTINNNNSSRIYNITNAGVDAAELERIQRQKELLYGD